MSKWYDEIRLCQHKLHDIGITFYIREIMKNSMKATYDELANTFGSDWRQSVDKLEKEGIIVAQYTKRMVFLKVVSTGDRRRYKMRIAAKKSRIANKNSK